MGRRKRAGRLGLLGAPWQLSLALAVAAFIGLRWILPALVPSRAVGDAFTPALDLLSSSALCVLGGISALAAVRAYIERSKQDQLAREIEEGRKKAMRAATIAAAPKPVPTSWSLEALQRLEWKRIELLCARYYELVGFRTETQASGPDGGIDVRLYKLDAAAPLALVQCKAWNTRQVGVKEMRELLGVMAHAKVGRGIFVATGGYTHEALAFARANPIQTLDGQALVDKITALPPEAQAELLGMAFKGDFHTPSCPSCGVKLRARVGKRGGVWGCRNYPKCKTLIQMTGQDAAQASGKAA